MQDAELKTSIKGSVLPASGNKLDIGDAPLQATIKEVNHNAANEETGRAADDCEFYQVELPGDVLKNFQTFLPTKPEELLHQIINVFDFLYGIPVILDQEIPASFAAGDVIKFKKSEA